MEDTLQNGQIPVLFVYELAVAPDYQNAGLGRWLMERAYEIALQTRMHKVMLTVFKENQRALGFYQKLG